MENNTDKQSGVLTYYWMPVLLTLIGLVASVFVGGFAGLLSTATLAPLEVSMSFDNAVLNAKVLKPWSMRWRKHFMDFGLPVAVIGMRLLFPLVIVAVIGHLNIVEALKLAIQQPKEYAHVLTSAHDLIAAFGGAFLFMVFFEFMLDPEKESHWLGLVEAPLSMAGKVEKLDVFLTLVLVAITSMFVEPGRQVAFLMAGGAGVLSFVAAHGLGSLLQGEDENASGAASRIIKEGIMGLLYLEVLDASCSFDGVIGALAISTNIFIIAIGLGIGAAYVRGMTLQLVEKDTLGEFKYLEHGAFWAIGALAACMFIGVHLEVPQAVTGLIGVASIVAALVCSLVAKKNETPAFAN